MSRKWEAPGLGVLFLGLEGSMYSMYSSVPRPVPEPRLAPGTRHIPSLVLVRILHGGQSKWAGPEDGSCRVLFSCKFLSRRLPLGLHLSCSRLRSRDWSVPGTVPFATSLGQSLLCIAPGLYPSATCAREPSSPFPGLARPVGLSTHPYRACDSAGPDTSGATRLWGGAVRPRSRLRSWGRVAVTSKGPAVPVIGRYVPREY